MVSTTSTSSPTPSHLFDRLPPEILSQIFEDVTKQTLSTEESRKTHYNILRSLCLVSKLFRSFAQSLLLKHVSLAMGSGHKLLERLFWNNSKEALGTVEVFYWDEEAKATPMLKKFVKLASNLQEVTIVCALSPLKAFFGSNITTLSLTNVTVSLEGAVFSFPQLLRLSMFNGEMRNEGGISFKLPKLKHLAWLRWYSAPNSQEFDLLGRLAPQLDSLTTCLSTKFGLPPSIFSLPSLSVLVQFWQPQQIEPTLDGVKNLYIILLAAKQKNGRDRVGAAELVELDKWIRLVGTPGHQLETLTVAPFRGNEPSSEALLRAASLVQACEEKGIEVDQGTTGGHPGPLEGSMSPQKAEIDHLSRLPVELLDSIFEQVVNVTPRPIAKPLLPSQERALYRKVVVSSLRRFSRLVRTLDARPHKGQHVENLTWYVTGGGDRNKIDRQSLLCHLSNLVEITFADFDAASSRLSLEQPELLPSLRRCQFFNTPIDSSTVDLLSRIPTLRVVGVSSIWTREDDENDWNPARQVLQLSLRCKRSRQPPTPSELLRFFPSAFISSIDVTVHDRRTTLKLFANLDSRLLSLRLQCENLRLKSSLIDHILPQLSNLRHLHLHAPFFSENLASHLLNLSNLESLSLIYHENIPKLEKLFDNLDRLPRLRELTIEYLGFKQGPIFDFGEVDEDADNPDARYNDPRSHLDNILIMADMDKWELPWSRNSSEAMTQAIKMEKKAEAVGLVVDSNLAKLVQHFELRVVECFNRAVGDLYFNGRVKPLEYALSLAKEHGLDIDRLGIDLEDDPASHDLEWFEFRAGRAQGFSGTEPCRVYGLKYEK
ncbi:uncharacterized protein JCM6883_003872 [Sporobolomyces salmoneus]|uniref:uncharacterized protein n=1 Tax=Sporobolomyces salmoneus TaxID=183962 RepID=UPI0031710167